MVYCGSKVMTKARQRESTCDYRLNHEGLPHLVPFMTKRVAYVTRDELWKGLQEGSLLISNLSKEVKEMVEAMQIGAFAAIYKPKEEDRTSGMTGPVDNVSGY